MTSATFWDRAAPKYAKSKISNMEAYEQTLARTRTHLGAETVALEFGCGTGTTALKIHQGTKRYVATDISSGMIKIANEKIEGTEGVQPEFRVAEIDAEAFEGQGFNTVLAFNLLHLLPDLEASLDEIRTILPEDGLFISKTPALAGRWYLKPLIWAMQVFGKAPFVRFLGVDELDAMVSAAGFRIVETGLYPPSAPSRYIVARKV